MKAVQANSCTFKTDKTSLTFLKVLVGRFLSVGQAGTATAGTVDIPPRLPRKVDVASAAGNEDLTPEEEKQVDSEVAALLQQFAEVCGKFPGFIGVRNGCVNVKQRLRLSNLSVQSHAAAWAAIYATRVSDFLFFQHRTSIDADGLGEWLRHRELMPLARAVIMFFNMDYLLTSEPLDVGEAIDPTVIPFLKTTLTAWFATAPQQPGETGDDVWQRWAAQIQIDEEVMKKHLRPALDCVLESLLRMWKALDPVCKHPAIMSSKVVSVGHLVKLCVPAGILKSLPMTQQHLEKYSRNASAPSSSRKVLSLTAPTTKLKPRSS